ICAALVIYLLVQGIRYLQPSLLWTNPRVANRQSETGGFLAPLLGTVFVTAIAMALATPIGIGVAVWLSEYARPRWLARLVESTVEMFAGAPSIVLALFGLILFRASFTGFLTERTGGIVYGKGFFPAGAMLALLALPLVVTSVRQGLHAIPAHVREASYALGKTKSATVRRVLLPAVRPDIITGSMVGAGHVIGDTAIIVLLLGDTYTLQPAGGVPLLSTLRGTGSTLTSYIFDNAPTGDLNQPNKAFAAAVVLIAMVVIINVLVDIFGRRARRLKWT
ncbi:MAG: ABC transporter permease subunit, partial [Acidobacteriota bacterium]|nr:ABC transporter permease subunit [Acidobacteriota bacterium]